MQTRGELSNAPTRLTIRSEGSRGRRENARLNKVYINRLGFGFDVRAGGVGLRSLFVPRSFVRRMFLLQITKALLCCKQVECLFDNTAYHANCSTHNTLVSCNRCCF